MALPCGLRPESGGSTDWGLMPSTPPTFEPHIRVSCIGRLGNPEADRFTFSVNMDSSNPPLGISWLEDNTVEAADLADDCVAFFGRANTRISQAATLDTVKIAHIGVTGAYVGDPVIIAVNQTGSIVQTGATLPQNALAVTLNTGRRGPSGRGRFFIPMPEVSVDSTDGFHINMPQAELIASSAEQFIEALNNHPGIDSGNMHVVVASTKGFNTGVSSIRVGRVVDTIRSRRNKLTEAYTPNHDVG